MSLVNMRPRSGPAFRLTDLFKAGQQGLLWLPESHRAALTGTSGATPTLFQDSAGTSPVGAIEQPVGRVIDQSGRGNHAAQSTAPARPKLTARLNLLTASEDLGSGVWTKSNATLGANGLIYPASQGLYRGAYQAAVGASVATNRVTFRLKSAGFRWVAILGSAGSGASGAFFDLVAGVVGFVYPGYSATITPAPDGFYDCAVQSPAEISYYAQIALCDENGNQTATPNGTNGVIFQQASMTLGSADLPYQRVNTATDYDWQAGRLALNFDGLDDGIGSTFAAGTLPANADVYVVLKRAASDVFGVPIYHNQARYPFAFGVGADPCFNGVGSGVSIGVNGALLATSTEQSLASAIPFNQYSILHAHGCALSNWSTADMGKYGDQYSMSSQVGAVLICPAQPDAIRTQIRKALAKQFGIQGVV